MSPSILANRDSLQVRKKNPPNSQPNAVNASENTREEKRTRDKLTLDYDHLNTLLYI